MGFLEAGRSESRFLLPDRVGTALVIGPGQEWREELNEFGVSVLDRAGSTRPDLAVCDPDTLELALESDAGALVVEGSVGARRLTGAGYHVRQYVALPSIERPSAFVPLGRRGPARYALLSWTGASRRWKRQRNRLLAAAMATGRVNVPRRMLTVASRAGVVPRLVAGAAAHGLPPDPDWILAPAQGDRLSRGVFLVFPHDEPAPSHVVKFARVPHWREPFELDEAALRLLDGASEVVTRHVPQVVGRCAVDGLEASIETAAQGQRMIGFLHTAASRQAKRQVIDAIAAWLMDLARATQTPPETLAAGRAELARELLAVGAAPDPGALLDAVARAPGVLQHNDLGTWNVVVQNDGFTVLDWESARRHGLPLWDLWYFLMDAEAHVSRASTLDEREEHFAQLFGGRSAASDFLFRWTHRIAATHGIERTALGPLATLCWVHHQRSGTVRREDFARMGMESAPPVFWLELLERLSQRWLSDPALGPGWPALDGA
jgi:hypothetical protein